MKSKIVNGAAAYTKDGNSASAQIERAQAAKLIDEKAC